MQELLCDSYCFAVNESRSSFDRFATHDGAPIKVLVEALDNWDKFLMKEAIRLFESKDKG
jgi:hypothetical protein